MKANNPMVRVATSYVARDGSSLEGAIRDMTTDIMHLCKKKKVDFDSIVTRAKEVYEQEKNLPE